MDISDQDPQQFNKLMKIKVPEALRRDLLSHDFITNTVHLNSTVISKKRRGKL